MNSPTPDIVPTPFEQSQIDRKTEAPRFVLIPMPGRVAIRIEDIERETKSGIILISDSHSPKPTTGTVVATCDSYEQDEDEFDPLFNVGDIVVFGKYTGTTVQVGQDKYVILRENDIMCRLVPSDSSEAVEARQVKINDRD